MASSSALNTFLQSFVAPLVAGGRVYVQGLLGPGILRAWQSDPHLDATLVASITHGMHNRLAMLGSVGSVDRLPHDVLALAAVWHNLLAMTHPEARTRRGLRRTVRAWSMEFLGWAGTPRTRAEASLRHAVLARLPLVGRVDTHVEFWAGYADFVGVSPPRALVALPTLRRVKVQRVRVDLYSLLRALEAPSTDDADIDLYPVVRAALAASPLTDIALAERPAPLTFAWTPATVNILGDATLRGALQRSVLARGTPAVRALESATLTSVRTRVLPPAAARALVSFHVEMAVLDALGARVGQSGLLQPLALDAYIRLGYHRASALTGIPSETLSRALPIDPSRPPPRDPPSAPLLSLAGLLETSP